MKYTYRPHWRSIDTWNEGQCMTTVADREVAHRIIGGLNDLQAGYFHWWYVAEPVNGEKQTSAAQPTPAAP